MSLSNTEVGCFTTTPASIAKTWTNTVLNTESCQPTDLTDKHRYNEISAIRLTIEYAESSLSTITEYNGVDDKSTDAIALWRENREIWSSLEAAVQGAVDEYINQLRKHSLSTKCRTMSAPWHRRTVVDNRRSSNLERHSEREHVGTGKRVRTIHPSESASAVSGIGNRTPTLDELQAFMSTMNVKNRGHKKASTKRKSGSKLSSIMEYATT